ncbi:MAG: phosphatidylserine/phosphatidylglycerophosphate/cardiolipin synthase-like enzyme [Flavobacteriales bacterium]|jgi:phosphatidylserine/phosphatidylglycerophosphate/cardiolipin synthase-like enzyme
MSTKFFTNRKFGENRGLSLGDKFQGVFKHMRDIHNFEAVIGYFRASGYFMIQDYLDDIPVVKILVGINVDKLIHSAHSVGIEYIGQAEDVRIAFKKEALEDIKDAAYSKSVEDGVIKLVEDLTSGKVQIRAFKTDSSSDGNSNLHCKLYIFTQEEEHDHAGWGTVITGSSNLSASGLHHNVEFNVELRDTEDVRYAKDFFTEIWENESIDILPTDIEKLKTETHLNSEVTPFELYVKFLITYFGKNIDIDHSIYSLLPDKYDNRRLCPKEKVLDFQKS